MVSRQFNSPTEMIGAIEGLEDTVMEAAERSVVNAASRIAEEFYVEGPFSDLGYQRRVFIDDEAEDDETGLWIGTWTVPQDYLASPTNPFSRLPLVPVFDDVNASIQAIMSRQQALIGEEIDEEL